MHDEHPHPLLAQIPLTVSPFLSLPAATTLPYTYKSLPSTLPPSATDPDNSHSSSTAAAPGSSPAPPPSEQQGGAGAPPSKPAYVVSATGHSAHPDDIIASCRALQAHLLRLEEEGRAVVARWEGRIRERELAEKRRVAPGWLDEEVRLLVPERKGEEGQVEGDGAMAGGMDGVVGTGTGPMGPGGGVHVQERSREGEELDRAFGGMNLR